MKKRAYYFSDGPYAQLLRQLYQDLIKPETFIQLVGGEKCGKSALCETLALYMERKGHDVVFIDYAVDSPEMLRSVLAQKFDLPSINNISRQLEDALVTQFEKPKLLIIDGAEQLSDTTLLEIQRLAEVQVDSQRVLNVLLCGDLELAKRIQGKKLLQPLLTNITGKALLAPMDRETVAQFFSDYGTKNGCSGIQLSSDALDLYAKFSKGYPGPVAQIAEWIVAGSRDKQEHRVLSKLDFSAAVNQVEIKQLLPPSSSSDSAQLKVLGPIAAVFLIALAGLVYQLSVSPEQEDLVAVVEEQQDQASLSPFVSEEAEPERLSAPVVLNEGDPAELQGGIAADAADSSASFAPSLLKPASVFSLDEDDPTDTDFNDTSAASQLAQADLPQENEEVVSDSALALVTAAELGVTPEIIEDVEIDLVPLSEDSSDSISSFGQVATEITEANQLAVSNPEANNPEVNNPELYSTAETLAEDNSAEPLVVSGGQVEVELASMVDASESTGVVVEKIEEDASAVALQQASEESLGSAVTETASSVGLSSPAQPIAAGQQTEIASIEAPSDEVLVRERIESWISAWQEQELGGYFASYSNNFEPRYESSVTRWRASRTRVIGNAEWIRLNLSEYEIIEQTLELAEIHFWLDYESPTYRDSTKKKLVLSNNDGEWTILEEINLQVRS
ncbi:MAG: AAA family ATPase [Pseudohongiellaceae bacterium]